MVIWIWYEDYKALTNSDAADNFQPPPYILPSTLLDLPGCNIPQIDPFAGEVKIFYKKLTHLNCGGKPSFLKIVNRTTLYIDHKLLSKLHRVKFKKCVYNAVIRKADKKKPDDSVKFVTRNNSHFTDRVTISDEFVKIACYSAKKLFHLEFRGFVQIKDNVEARCKGAWEPEINSSTSGLKHEERLSVLIFGIDSISKLNFLRHFPKTYTLLKKIKAFELHGYNKVQENTIVNMVPFLTGKHLNNSLISSKFCDKIDLLWKDYERRGYRTLFAEDAPTIGMFNYRKKGFHNVPSDYYFRPLALAIENSNFRKKSKNHCFGNILEFKYILDWVQDFVTFFKDKPYFSLVFLSRLTHDLLNYAGYADEPSHEFLSKLYQNSSTMNNTVLIFMSDHGIRFGGILKTYVGKLEERLPFMFVKFPDWYLKKYPSEAKNLKVNERRLTSPFDMFETLKDILEYNTGWPVTERPSPGVSILKEIPENRTCEDVLISAHYCACHRYEPMPINATSVLNASKAIIKHVNKKTENIRDKCAELKTTAILQAQSNQPTSALKGGTNMIQDYLIVIKVTPSDGEFEATVRYSSRDDTYRVQGDANRINMYGNQSSCISDQFLLPVCYCKR